MAVFAGEVIDGVIATVNRKPLLQSDWDDAVRFEAFMQQKPLRRNRACQSATPRSHRTCPFRP